MNVWVTVLFIGDTAFSFVECGCYYLKPRTDYDALCWEWWYKGFTYRINDNARVKCMKLIKDKCPYMIDIEITIIRTYDDDKNNYESWKTEVKGLLKKKQGTCMLYYLYEKKSLCFDDGGKVTECSLWWKIARNVKLKNNVKENCIQRIKDHCGDMIIKTEEVNICKVQRCKRGYDIMTVTYQRGNGETASFDVTRKKT